MKHARQLVTTMSGKKRLAILDTGPWREFAFTDANTSAGNIQPLEAVHHKRLFREELLKYELEPVPDWSFLLNVPYEKCHERMKARAFANENLLPLDYFRQIEEAHLNIFGNLNEHGFATIVASGKNLIHCFFFKNRYLARKGCYVVNLLEGHGFIEPEQIFEFIK